VSSGRDHRVVLGTTIRANRVRAGLTLEVLAEKADLHPNYLGRVERGEEYISVSALLRIAKSLRIRIGQLFAEL